MRWTRRMSPTQLALSALVVTGCLALPARASNATDLGRQLLELDRTTGTEPLKGEYLELTKNPDKAKKLIAYAQAQVKDGKTTLSYNAALILAEAAKDLNLVEASEAFFRTCAKQAAELESTRKLLQSYGGLIDLLYESKKFGESAKVCKELLELKPKITRPRVVLLSVTNELGETDFIPDDSYDSARRLRPAVHRLLIQAIAKQGKYDQALKLVDNLIKAQDHWEERQLKGWVQREAGQFEEAARTYEDVLDRIKKDKELEPKEKEVYEDRYRYVLSNVYVDLNDINKAADQLQTLVKKHPDEPGYQNDLGYVWADHDMKLPEAEKLIRRALELDRKRREAIPELAKSVNGAYLDSLGWVLFKQKKLKEARKALTEALEDKNSQHIEIYDHLGDVCMALGDREAALNAWRRGVEVAGESRREQRLKTEVEKKIDRSK